MSFLKTLFAIIKRERRAGQEMANGLGIKLCWCPAGRFVMGSPEGELGRFVEEAQVRVEITRGFWIG